MEDHGMHYWEGSALASHEQEIDHESRPVKRRRVSRTDEQPRAREVGLMRDGMGLNSASFVGSASGIHFIRSVQGALNGLASSSRTPTSNQVPGEDDRLQADSVNAGQKPLWQSHEIDESPSTSGSSFSFDELVGWTNSYFEIWHQCFPFLHAPSVLDMFEDVASHGLDQQSPCNITILRSLVSISIADRRQSNQILPRPPPHWLAFSSFNHALESTNFALVNPATIPRLQAVLSVQLFLVSMLRLNGAARIGGLVNGLAFQLGLHRCPARYPAFSQLERELRQRLFWSIYCLERHVCQALGLPLTIHDDDVDVCYPDKERHHPPEPSRQSRSGELTPAQDDEPDCAGADDRLKLLSLLARHAQIKGEILELRNKNVASRDETIDKAVLVDARLTRWWNEVQDVFEQVDAEELVMADIHRVVLTLSKHESKIILNRPLLAARDSPNYAGALHSCILNSKGVLSTLQRHFITAAGLSNSSTGSTTGHYETLPMCWPSWTWAVWMSAFVTMYAASENEVPRPVAHRLLDRSLDLLDRLAVRGSMWPNACAVAIKDLRVALSKRLKWPMPADNSRRESDKLNGRMNNKVDGDGRLAEQHGQQTPPLVSVPTPDSLLPAGTQAGASTVSPSFPNLGSDSSLNQGSQGQDLAFSANPFMQQAFNMTANGGITDGGYATRALWSSLEDGSLLPVDVQPYQFNDLADPFQGFDIPFWLGQDNYAGWLREAM